VGNLRRVRIAAALWGGFLFLLTSWPRPPRIPAIGLPLDLLTHFFLYAVEGFLLFRAIRWPGTPGATLARILVVTGALAVWGMFDEVHQEWIPGRRMESIDLAADVAGAAVGGLLGGVLPGRQADS
jgi:VanZ family protein